MSKFYYVFFAFWLLLPQTANAVLVVPSADIIVVVNTSGGESSFNFEFSGVGPFSYFENFSLSTQSGSASYTVHIPFLAGSDYQLKQILPADWGLGDVNCTGSFSTTGSTVRLTVSAFTTTTCIFSNQKFFLKNPVLFIPGITGTELLEGASMLWPDAIRMTTDIGDQFMDRLGFDQNLNSLGQIKPGSVLRKPANIFDYTESLIREFESRGYQEEVDLFTFPYDWRFGTSEHNIQALKNKIEIILSTSSASKIDVVAHSAGGVLLKKYILDNSNHHINKAIFVGVPNLGAPKALKILLEGDNLDVPVLSSKEIKKIARNMPGVYQLAPSGEYQNTAGASFATHTQNLFSASDIDFSFSDMQNYLASNKDLNPNAFSAANILHTFSFDSADLSARGVEVYSIVGCRQPTLGKIIERKTDNPLLRSIVNGYAAKFIAGDGTVPLVSAEKIPSAGSPIFYALDSSHGKMPSQQGIRQQIVRIITADSGISPAGITQDRGQCKLNGKEISIYSPLDISVTDIAGNITKVNNNGDVQVGIPGSNLEILGDHKFLFLPDGHSYDIKVEGTDAGTFTLVTDQVTNGQTTERQVFANVPVTTSLRGSLELDSSQLKLDNNGDGNIDLALHPYQLNQSQINDSAAPTTQVVVGGAQGGVEFFRSNVNITFSATDQLSGILSTKYSLDGGEVNSYMGPILVSLEGSHVLTYFSIDKAGNVETPKTAEFTIDKTPPELIIQFNGVTKDLMFAGDGVVVDDDDSITLSDKAGNVTKMILKEKDRKRKLKAEIKKLFYNGVEADITKNVMKFDWAYSNNGILKKLDQRVKSKKEFNIFLDYNGQSTVITGKDVTGNVNRTIMGHVNSIGPIGLKVQTNKGELEWSY